MREALEKLIIEAGKAALRHFRTGAAITYKPDASPVTAADKEAEAIITAGLAVAFPSIPVVAEEAVSCGRTPTRIGPQYFLVDPVDGTREFVEGRDEFTVNIGLVRDGAPVAGLVYAPARGQLFEAIDGEVLEATVDGNGAIANRTPIAVSGRELPACIVASRSHLNARTRDYLDRHAGTACRHVGSSLKFCLVARGEADLYPSFRATMQWDTAAGDAILRAAGGETRDAEGDLLSYLPDLCVDGVHFCNPSFVATGYRRR